MAQTNSGETASVAGGASKDSEQPKAVQKFMSKTATLGYFLPTGTNLLFDTVVAQIYRNGQCSYIGTIMMWLLLGLCVVICFFSQFTDSKTSVSAKDRNPKVAYEIAKLSDWKKNTGDLVHAITSVVAFLTIAFSDHRVVDCVLPAHVKEVEDAMLSLHIILLSVCSFVHLVFPVTMRGLMPKFAYDRLEVTDISAA